MQFIFQNTSKSIDILKNMIKRPRTYNIIKEKLNGMAHKNAIVERNSVFNLLDFRIDTNGKVKIKKMYFTNPFEKIHKIHLIR